MQPNLPASSSSAGKQTGGCSQRRWKRIRRAVVAPLLFILLGVVLSSCRTALTPLPPEADRGYQELLEWSVDNGMPGAILLVRTPRGEFLGNAGYADLKRHIPMRTNHAFQIGSITKSFVGVVCAQMHAEGIVNLDGCITNWLGPELTAQFPNADQVTLRHLLEHTSGFRDYGTDFRRNLSRAFLDRHGEWGPRREIEFVYDKPADFLPGERMSYSNTGYALAGLILDRVAGQHHSVEIRRRILDPLHLTNTWYMATEAARGEVARGYEHWFHWWWTDTTHWTPATGGGAGLASTVSDLATFVRAAARPDDLLSDAARQEALANWTEGTKWYFLGLQRERSREGAPWFLGHSGGTPGYHCFAFHEPERDITIVYFGSSTLRTARGDQRLDMFYKTLRNELFERTRNESEQLTDFDSAGDGQ
jgi:D-alanyl-D-alanine carboxypeptidase